MRNVVATLGFAIALSGATQVHALDLGSILKAKIEDRRLTQVPELDPETGGAACMLVGAGMALFAGRRRRDTSV